MILKHFIPCLKFTLKTTGAKNAKMTTRPSKLMGGGNFLLLLSIVETLGGGALTNFCLISFLMPFFHWQNLLARLSAV
jgi:hypothetical protein